MYLVFSGFNILNILGNFVPATTGTRYYETIVIQFFSWNMSDFHNPSTKRY